MREKYLTKRQKVCYNVDINTKEGEEMAEIKSYKCPCCGAPLKFSEKKQKLSCAQCGNSFDTKTLEQLDEAEQGTSGESKYDWTEYEPREFDAAESEGFASYECPSCGAQITGDKAMGATMCPYCGNATIVEKQFSGSLKPDLVIPFKLDKKAAMAKFEEAAKQAPFLPNEFKDRRRIEKMTGVYVPFWLFGCDCDANIVYDANDVSHWSDRDYEYTKTDYYKIYRSGVIGFENIPVDGSKKAADNYMDALEPFDFSEAVDFNTAYLSGFLADKYDVDAKESVERANKRMKKTTEEEFARTVHHQWVTPIAAVTAFKNTKIRYALIPVWMLNIKYEGAMYKYAINGQTGKTVGEYPICKKKKWKYFFKVFGITLLIIIALYAIIWGWLTR